jgi:hypothetical protein
MAVGETYFDNDGKAVHVALTATINKNEVAYAEGLLGIAAGDGESGDTIALTIDFRAYQFQVPSGLSVTKGQTVYVDITDTTGHRVDSTAYFTASGANRYPLFKALETKDSNNVVIGKLFGGLGLI